MKNEIFFLMTVFTVSKFRPAGELKAMNGEEDKGDAKGLFLKTALEGRGAHN